MQALRKEPLLPTNITKDPMMLELIAQQFNLPFPLVCVLYVIDLKLVLIKMLYSHKYKNLSTEKLTCKVEP